MNRNLDKDDIRDASDLLTHIDGWEKTGLYDEEAIKELDRWHRKRNQIARDADALYEQLYERYQAYVDEHPVHKQQAEDIAVQSAELQELGWILTVPPMPAPAIDNKQVAFFYHKNGGLIEIVEKGE